MISEMGEGSKKKNDIAKWKGKFGKVVLYYNNFFKCLIILCTYIIQ